MYVTITTKFNIDCNNQKDLEWWLKHKKELVEQGYILNEDSTMLFTAIKEGSVWITITD